MVPEPGIEPARKARFTFGRTQGVPVWFLL